MAARILLVLDVIEQKPSAVTEAIAKLGSVRRVAMAADVPAETVYLARARGRFLQAGPVPRLAEALHPDDPVRQFGAREEAGRHRLTPRHPRPRCAGPPFKRAPWRKGKRKIELSSRFGPRAHH